MPHEQKDPLRDSTAPQAPGLVPGQGDDTLSGHADSPPPFATSSTIGWTGQGPDVAEGFVDAPAKGPVRVSRGVNFAANRARRIAAAHDLLARWSTASSHIADRSFGVYLDGFLEEVRSWMAAFRAVPNEEVFSGILQLVRDAVTGANFLRVQEGGRAEVVDQVLQIPANRVDLTLGDYDMALGLVLEKDLGAWRNACD